MSLFAFGWQCVQYLVIGTGGLVALVFIGAAISTARNINAFEEDKE